MSDILLNVFLEGILNKASSLVEEGISMVLGVKEDLESLEKNLEMIQALLADAESKHTSSRAVELWLKWLQNVSSEADNVLGELAYDFLHMKRKQNKVSSFFSSSNPIAFRFKIAHKVKKMNLSIEEVYQEADRIGLKPANFRSDRLISPHPFVDECDIVGRSEDIEKIVSVLASSEKDEKNLSVVGIVGIPGLGKTTVAQLVSKNEKVARHFDHIFWIHVPDDFNVERLLSEMVQSLKGTISELIVVEEIVRQLNKLLKAKRFLLVLDDVWIEDAEKWDRMKNCLLEIGGLKGSRVLVTTRSERVVSIMQASFTCQLGILSDDDSWKLFEEIAFGLGGAVKTDESMDIGRRIVALCGGVPLAVKAVGSLLYFQKEEGEWSKIENSETWCTLNEGGNRVKSAIKLSYDYLPSLTLKQCLACCTSLEKGSKKGSDIGVEILIQLWLAQGLCNPSKDVANDYINILLRSSLLQVGRKDEYGKATHLKMHDIVCNFLSEVAKDCFLVPLGEPISDRKILSKQRTLVLSDGLEHILPNCQHLRVLTVVNEGIKEFPIVISKLKHLTYLDISRTSIAELPNSITKLYNLQSLRLHNLQQLPKDFVELTNLRHLDIQGEGIINGKPCFLPDIGRLISLQTLPFFFVSPDKGCQLDELGHLHNLKGKLKIFGLENVSNQEEAVKAKISSKINLDNLELHWGTKAREESTDKDVLKGLEPNSNLKGLIVENFIGRNLPSWMSTTSHPFVLCNLVKIILKNFKKCQHIPPLGHLPHLKIIKMIGMERVIDISSDFYGWKNLNDASSSQGGPAAGDAVIGFPALKELILEDMPSLLFWSGLEGHAPPHSAVKLFPHLEILIVKKCPLLMSLPDGIWSHLGCIKKLTIEDCHILSHLPEDIGRLASLEVLNLQSCPNLASIPDIHSLGSLSWLVVFACDKLRSLPSGIEACTSINKLTLSLCPALRPEDLHRLSTLRPRGVGLGGFSGELDYFPWPNCTVPVNGEFQQHCFAASLEGLVVIGWPKLTSLPEQIQHLSSLTSLYIAVFDEIDALPEWLGSIKSLEYLQISSCKNLMYLPSAEAMQRLTNLRSLRIDESCPLLKERCKKEIGPEWNKIAHIPEIEME